MFFKTTSVHYKVQLHYVTIDVFHLASYLEISLAEGQMGKYLMISSINECTSSASTMEKTGKLLSSLSNKRFKITAKPMI